MIVGFIILILPFIAIASLLVYGVIYFTRRNKIGKQSKGYHFLRYVFVGYCLSLFYLTIGWYYPDITFSPSYHLLYLHPFIWVTDVYTMGVKHMIEQLILNIGMFVPYGILLPLVFDKLRKPLNTMGVVLHTTVGIETLQYFIGRSADVDDVIMNTIGGLIGYGSYSLICKWRER